MTAPAAVPVALRISGPPSQKVTPTPPPPQTPLCLSLMSDKSLGDGLHVVINVRLVHISHPQKLVSHTIMEGGHKGHQ